MAVRPTTPTGTSVPQHDAGHPTQQHCAGSPGLMQQRRGAASILPPPVRSSSPPTLALRGVSVERSEQLANGGTILSTARFEPPPKASLTLSATEHAELAALYGNAVVADAIAHDCFADVAALRRQLAHEAKTEITLTDYYRMDPFCAANDDLSRRSVELASGADLPDAYSIDRISVTHGDGVISQRWRTFDAHGKCIAFDAAGRFGLPTGWIAEDTVRRCGDGITQVRTRLTGPNGESGAVMRRFDGKTLHLDEAYKSTLPTRLAGVPGFDRSVATVNYLTARACKLLGVTAQNLQQIRVNQLQHQPVLMHLDWLLRKYPGKSMGELIDRTTWAKSYVRETAAIVGRRVIPGPTIDPEGSPAWVAEHSGAVRRSWPYLQSETKRLTFEHLTREKIDQIDTPSGAWKTSAATALARYKAAQCQGLSPVAASARMHEIDTLLQKRLAAISAEETGLRRRYDLPADRVPRHLNFDVTYQTMVDQT